MSVRLVLVRHGSTDWSDAGRLNGWTDVPLNENGRREALSLGARLAGRVFEGVWTSDLARATETARLAVREFAEDARLRELDFGALEGKRWDDCSHEVQQALVAFDGFRAPGGESVEDLRSRVARFLGDLPEGDHAIFTHGGVIRLVLRSIDRETSVPPGGLVEASWTANRLATDRRS